MMLIWIICIIYCFIGVLVYAAICGMVKILLNEEYLLTRHEQFTIDMWNVAKEQHSLVTEISIILIWPYLIFECIRSWKSGDYDA